MSQHPSEIVRAKMLEHRLTGLTGLVDLTCRLAAEQDLNRILRLVTTEVCEALGCERASLFLYDETRRELYTRIVTELEISEIRHSIDVGISGWVARCREIANVPDPALDQRWNDRYDRETGFRTENILAAPLVSKHDGRLLGVLQLLNKPDGCFDAFDEHLLEAFAAHATVALERAQLLEELRRTQLLEASIGLARDIQAGLLPENLPDLPGYEVAAWWQPAEGVGGDYYDVIPLSDGRLALTVADVSGHGVGPSLIMASARAMLHILTRTCTDPEKILTLLSESIAPDLRDGRFITFFLGVLDARRHQFAFANSGHAPALYFRRRTGSILPLESTSFPLGVCPEIPVPSGPSINFEPGDILLLATDGTIEQHNAAGEMFGLERIKSILSRQYTASAELLVELLRKAVNDFYRGPHPADDVTLLVIKRLDGA